MAELTPDLPGPVVEAIGRDGSLIVLRMEPQPELIRGIWGWKCPAGHLWHDWLEGDEPLVERDMGECSPLGQPGTVLVVQRPITVAVPDTITRPAHFESFTATLRLTVASVAVRQLWQMKLPDLEAAGITEAHDAALASEEFKVFWNLYNPDHPWSPEQWAWCAEVTNGFASS